MLFWNLLNSATEQLRIQQKTHRRNKVINHKLHHWDYLKIKLLSNRRWRHKLKVIWYFHILNCLPLILFIIKTLFVTAVSFPSYHDQVFPCFRVILLTEQNVISLETCKNLVYVEGASSASPLPQRLFQVIFSANKRWRPGTHTTGLPLSFYSPLPPTHPGSTIYRRPVAKKHRAGERKDAPLPLLLWAYDFETRELFCIVQILVARANTRWRF